MLLCVLSVLNSWITFSCLLGWIVQDFTCLCVYHWWMSRTPRHKSNKSTLHDANLDSTQHIPGFLRCICTCFWGTGQNTNSQMEPNEIERLGVWVEIVASKALPKSQRHQHFTSAWRQTFWLQCVCACVFVSLGQCLLLALLFILRSDYKWTALTLSQ